MSSEAGLASKEFACNAGDPGLIPGSGRSPGEKRGYPLHCFCLENSTDRGTWWATVLGSKRVSWAPNTTLALGLTFMVLTWSGDTLRFSFHLERVTSLVEIISGVSAFKLHLFFVNARSECRKNNGWLRMCEIIGEMWKELVFQSKSQVSVMLLSTCMMSGEFPEFFESLFLHL